VAKAAGTIDRAEKAHQDRERADRLEAVRMRGEPAHRMEGDGLPVTVSCSAPRVGPRDRQLDLLVARGDAELLRESMDRRRRDPVIRRPIRACTRNALEQQLMDRLHRVPSASVNSP
jgi:hypothetical protein